MSATREGMGNKEQTSQKLLMHNLWRSELNTWRYRAPLTDLPAVEFQMTISGAKLSHFGYPK